MQLHLNGIFGGLGKIASKLAGGIVRDVALPVAGNLFQTILMEAPSQAGHGANMVVRFLGGFMGNRHGVATLKEWAIMCAWWDVT